MYTIQYEAVDGTHKMQVFGGTNRANLVRHLSHFERPIIAVYEQTTPITKAMRNELAQLPRHTMTRSAREFTTQA